MEECYLHLAILSVVGLWILISEYVGDHHWSHMWWCNVMEAALLMVALVTVLDMILVSSPPNLLVMMLYVS